jgi:hypothetical protein
MSISVKYPIIGAKVVRGKDWCYDEQDGGEGKTGVIVDKLKYDWVRVLWENGNKDDYRIGNEGKYDLYFATEKDALLQEAMERFPSGCSYEDTMGSHHKNIKYNYPYWWSESRIALKEGKGLVYDNGKWAVRTDVPVKEEYAKIIKHKTINTDQNGEKSKSNPSSNGSTNTTNVECSTKRENGIKVQRLNFKIPTTVRSGGAGLKSSNCKVRFGSNNSYHQKRLSIS